MEKETSMKKISTGIEGLDDLFYGGIHLEQRSKKSDGLLIMARGEHGVNKIHLAMQMCEGLYISELKELSYSKKSGDSLGAFTPLSQRSNLRLSFPIRMYFLEESERILKEKLKKYSEKQAEKEESEPEKENRERLSTLYDYCIKDEHYARLCAMKYIDVIFRSNVIKRMGLFDQEGVLDRVELFKKKKEIIEELLKEENAKKVIDVFLKYSSMNHFSKNYSNPELLFISLNKDGKLINSLYFDFYIQRLFKRIKTQKDDENAGLLLHNMLWYRDDSCIGQNSELESTKREMINSYAILSISRLRGEIIQDKNKREQRVERGIEKMKKDIKSGYIYYNERTHGIHLRHQTGAEDTGEMLLCKVYIPKESRVAIIGRDELNGNNRMTDGLTSFLNMLRILDYYLPDKDMKKKVDFIMIDGLSCLTHEEIAQCSFNALSDKLRKTCMVGVVTADNKAPTSYTDIVIDMAIKEGVNPDQLCNLLRISKCLYQRNAYGWHSYKMRVAGIEVIPSLRFQTITRFLMDDAVADALLPINVDPYPYWLNGSSLYEDKDIEKAICDYAGVDIDDKDKISQIDYHNSMGALRGVLHYDNELAIRMIVEELKKEEYKEHGFLFIDLNLNRTEFKKKNYDMIKQIRQKDKEKIHLFTFQPGYLHADEFLWTIDQQVQAISKTINKYDRPDTQYDQIHLIIGDLNYLSFAYPCLNKEGLVLPAIASYTKKHHMTNYVYATVRRVSNEKLLDKETEIIRQMNVVVGSDNLINCLSELNDDK